MLVLAVVGARFPWTLNLQTADNTHKAVGPNLSLSTSKSSVVALFKYSIAKWHKILLSICCRSRVWMWPIKLNARDRVSQVYMRVHHLHGFCPCHAHGPLKQPLC